jgi:hypothetical protein
VGTILIAAEGGGREVREADGRFNQSSATEY